MNEGKLDKVIDWLARKILGGPVLLLCKLLIPAPPKNTVETYQNLFRGKLRGVWDTAQYCVTPVDSYVHFLENGRGLFSCNLSGHAEDFAWRQVGDFEIEVKADGDEDWTRLTYGFGKFEDEVSMGFRGAGELPDWVFDLTSESFPLARM